MAPARAPALALAALVLLQVALASAHAAHAPQDDDAHDHYDPDVDLNTPQTIRRHGYPAESHVVQTADGYLLTVHRIPGPRLANATSATPANGTTDATPTRLPANAPTSAAPWPPSTTTTTASDPSGTSRASTSSPEPPSTTPPTTPTPLTTSTPTSPTPTPPTRTSSTPTSSTPTSPSPTSPSPTSPSPTSPTPTPAPPTSPSPTSPSPTSPTPTPAPPTSPAPTSPAPTSPTPTPPPPTTKSPIPTSPTSTSPEPSSTNPTQTTTRPTTPPQTTIPSTTTPPQTTTRPTTPPQTTTPTTTPPQTTTPSTTPPQTTRSFTTTSPTTTTTAPTTPPQTTTAPTTPPQTTTRPTTPPQTTTRPTTPPQTTTPSTTPPQTTRSFTTTPPTPTTTTTTPTTTPPQTTTPSPVARPVIFLQHGLLGSSYDWIVAGPGKGLAYLLADAGYDVWMGNARGNTYSRAHVYLPTESSSPFWDFSFHEMGIYDLPAVIDHILNATGVPQLHYVGHSMGTTMFFVMASMRPEAAAGVASAHALAPVVFVRHIKSPIRLLAPFARDVAFLAGLLGDGEFLPQNKILHYLAKYGCELLETERDVCENLIFILCGYDKPQFDTNILPVLLSHTPAGASTRTLIHYAQMIKSGKFQQYDLGKYGNLKKYRDLVPPTYDLTKVNVSVQLVYANNDWLAAPLDVNDLYQELRCTKSKYLVPLSSFNHLDFILAKDVKTLLYDKLLKEIPREVDYQNYEDNFLYD